MTWTEQLIDGAWPADVIEWRRTHSWGGFEWFPEPEQTVLPKRWVRGEEDLDEIEWLLDGDVHPLLVAQTIGRSAAAIYRTAKRHKRATVVAAFATYSTQRTTTAARRGTKTNERKAS